MTLPTGEDRAQRQAALDAMQQGNDAPSVRMLAKELADVYDALSESEKKIAALEDTVRRLSEPRSIQDLGTLFEE